MTCIGVTMVIKNCINAITADGEQEAVFHECMAHFHVVSHIYFLMDIANCKEAL